MLPFREEPLYTESAGRILDYSQPKKNTDIQFRRPPMECDRFTAESVERVFGNVSNCMVTQKHKRMLT